LIVNSKSKFSPIKTRIDYRGRIYLPIKVRRTLQLKPNIEINLVCKGNSIVLSACGN